MANVWVFLGVMLLGIGAFAWIVAGRIRLIMAGKQDGRMALSREQAKAASVQVFGHRRLLQDRRSGAMHLVLFYGFLVLQIGALEIIVKGVSGRSLPLADRPWFGLVQELTVALVLLAVAYAGYRRYVRRLSRLPKGRKPALVLIWISALMISIALTLAFDRLREGREASAMAPLSSPLASGLDAIPAAVGYESAWWAHLVLLLGFLVYVPLSKHFHLMTAPVNWLFRPKGPPTMTPLDLEDESAEKFGMNEIADLTRATRLDLFACVECGRCTDVCPAANTDKGLSPMHLMTKLRDTILNKGMTFTPAFATPAQSNTDRMDIHATMAWQSAGWIQSPEGAEPSLIGEVVTEQEIWSCTTCRACEERCPVGNRQLTPLIEMRRYLVLTEGRMPAEAKRTLQNIDRQSNPWGFPRQERAAWIEAFAAREGWRIPTIRDNPKPQWLWWVGSMGAYDLRARGVTFAFARLLREAGVSFAVLGAEERNSGDTPRRLGDEYLFQELCRGNVETFKRYGIKRIVTTCPHTYHLFRNEYRDFGFEGEVRHHTELLSELVQAGRLKPRHAVDKTLTFHDSCYLARYNGITEAPRAIMSAIPGLSLNEMEKSGKNGLCCGAGGGRMWLEEPGRRVNEVRTAQALHTGADIVGSSCPYCLTMMEEGLRKHGAEERTSALDVAELLAMSVFPSRNRER
ncbi:heterodisulfide reductase-related iron-sulfur binding cluster [Cohnella panacarvi]|uniref:heterodisulfide reductase-related iron-sulfur binding cluster n=1 Tax=Cohnella panacarvi TaxID=400776 RepID=UPI00047ADF2F|nr:heterodisulfide reductase-related iron-sulfur binding cluster [Cohnella panacarvi]